MTRNPLLVILTDSVSSVTAKFVEEVVRTSNRTVMPFRRHLLADLRRRDREAAADRMRAHLLQLQKIYLAAVARLPETTSHGTIPALAPHPDR